MIDNFHHFIILNFKNLIISQYNFHLFTHIIAEKELFFDDYCVIYVKQYNVYR